MREIKFRLFRKDRGMRGPFDLEEFSYDQDGEFGEGDYSIGENGILMQFTGLKDKNGKEIYEGDVLDNYGGKYNSIVEWNAGEDDECRNYIAGFWLNYEPGDLEVIGNIYENPELIAEKR